MKQLFSSTLVAVMVIACCYGSVSALEAPDMRASLTLQKYKATTAPTKAVNTKTMFEKNTHLSRLLNV